MESKTDTRPHVLQRTGSSQNRALAQSPIERSWLRARLTGPGAIYNIGNILALSAGFLLNANPSASESSLLTAVYSHFMGSPEALWLTAAMMMFIVSGEIYHRAHTAPDKLYLVAWGDLVSGLAAIALTVALVQLGDTALALVAGLMLTLAKLGNASLPLVGVDPFARVGLAFRVLAMVSRLPSILSLVLAVLVSLQAGAPWGAVILPTIMIVCFVLWLWADLLLLKPLIRFWGTLPR